MQITIHHRLTLAIGADVPRAVQHLLLTPVDGPTQTVHEWHVEMPGIDEAPGFFDAFGNRAHLASQTRPDAELSIVASGVVETIDFGGVVGRLERDPVAALFLRVTPLTKAAGALVNRLRQAPRQGQDRIPFLHDLMARVAEMASPQQQSQVAGSQVQRQSLGGGSDGYDAAHAFVGAARALGIPARLVTGYWAGDEDQPPRFHAWAEAHDDTLGWIGFDPSLGYCPTTGHVRLACGLDAHSTLPVRCCPEAGSWRDLAMQVDIVAQ